MYARFICEEIQGSCNSAVIIDRSRSWTRSLLTIAKYDVRNFRDGIVPRCCCASSRPRYPESISGPLSRDPYIGEVSPFGCEKPRHREAAIARERASERKGDKENEKRFSVRPPYFLYLFVTRSPRQGALRFLSSPREFFLPFPRASFLPARARARARRLAVGE